MSITKISTADLSSGLKKTLQRAEEARKSKGLDFAIELYRMLLKKQPGCEEVQLNLLNAHIERCGGKVSGMNKFFGALKSLPVLLVKGNSLINKGQIAEALEAADKAVGMDPTSAKALQLLAKAALAAELDELAVAAVEAGLRFNPTNQDFIGFARDSYLDMENVPRAVQLQKNLLDLRPNDMDAKKLFKDLAAQEAMNKGYTKDKSYRDNLKDKDQAQEMEQAEARTIRSGDDLDKLLATALKRNEEQDNVVTNRRIADVYYHRKEYDNSIHYYEIAMERNGSPDPDIDQQITKVNVTRIKDAIAEWKEYGKSPEHAEEAAETVAELELQQAQYELDRAGELVERFPNDNAFKYQYGRMLYNIGEYDAAMKQLQPAQKAPQHRINAMLYLARCMEEKNMLDMAIDVLNTAIAEYKPMDNTKKELLYEIAQCYDKSGDKENALKNLKVIYAEDVDFRDVADLITNSYN